ncbi:hypothetical protein PSEUBRA_005254 [Kalmanozyma brasiliensis GHG001]|uniref:uncharacterized protein n=1 Tax=Kalmanozyma brasiliensis (strain GHG001) TaxID=1365824 RepID=UPI0028681515|nr:uncharacterized protein PSEUBRA_005254 [Kalmanozyma brasiliensis GHG001]KAF6767497.1 hypothetical protein PSEUBRA_005254 [Kalmanozyma brasiliensis GHG001]
MASTDGTSMLFAQYWVPETRFPAFQMAALESEHFYAIERGCYALDGYTGNVIVTFVFSEAMVDYMLPWARRLPGFQSYSFHPNAIRREYF